MRVGIFGSATIHVAVLAATMIAWPHDLDIASDAPPHVPVELVTIADVTNIAPTVPDEPEPEKQPPPQEPKLAALPPEPEPEPEAEAAPPELDLVPEEKVEETPPPAPKAAPRQKPKPPVKKKEEKFDLDRILAKLDEQKPAADARKGERRLEGAGARTGMTMSETDALLAQMRECWNLPAGAPEPEKLIVTIHVYLNPDGTLARSPEVSGETRAAAALNPYMRMAAENALRAVYVCEPYRMPVEKYASWREIRMTFDPSKMVAQ